MVEQSQAGGCKIGTGGKGRWAAAQRRSLGRRRPRPGRQWVEGLGLAGAVAACAAPPSPPVPVAPEALAREVIVLPWGAGPVTDSVAGVWVGPEAAADTGAVRAWAWARRPRALPPLVLAEAATVAGWSGVPLPPVEVLVARLAPEQLRTLGAALGRWAQASGVAAVHLTGPPAPGNGPDPWFLQDRERAREGWASFLDGLATSGARPFLALWAPTDTASVPWDRARLTAVEETDLAAWAPLLDGVDVGLVRWPALSGDRLPSLFSPRVGLGWWRRDRGAPALLVADLRPTAPAAAADAAIAALTAGVDLVLLPRGAASVATAVAAAIRQGRLPATAARRAAERVRRWRMVRARGAVVPPEAHLRALLRAAWREAILPLPAATSVDTPAVLVAPRGRWHAPLSPGVRWLPWPPSLDAAQLAQLWHRSRTVIVADGLDTVDLAAAVNRLAPLPEGASPLRLRFTATRALPTLRPGRMLVVWAGHPEAQRAAARALRQPPRPPPPGLQWPPAPVLRQGRPAEAGLDPAGLTAADAALVAAVRDGVIPGAALAVARRGVLVRLRGYGTIGTGTPVSPLTTRYDLASLTKVVGPVAAAMVLVDQGRLRLDQPVRSLLPDFRGEGKGRVTIRHLLLHTSGLPPGNWLFGAADPEAAVRRPLRTPLVAPPGTRTIYSDLGMILLALALERLTDQPLDVFLAAHVYRPLGMSRTGYLPSLDERLHLAPTAPWDPERGFPLWGVVHDPNAFRLGGVAGHAGLFAPAYDLAVFAQTLLNGGAYGTVRWIQPATVQRFTTRIGDQEFALGWDTPGPHSAAGDFVSRRAFGHLGYTGTSIWIDPAKEMFVVLLTNRTYTETDGRAVRQLRRAVHNALFGAVR